MPWRRWHLRGLYPMCSAQPDLQNLSIRPEQGAISHRIIDNNETSRERSRFSTAPSKSESVTASVHLLLHGDAECCVGGLKHGRRVGDGDRFGELTCGEGNVYRKGLESV